jgi:hypothetical protein
MSVILMGLSLAGVLLPGHPGLAFALGFLFEVSVAFCVGKGLARTDEDHDSASLQSLQEGRLFVSRR